MRCLRHFLTLPVASLLTLCALTILPQISRANTYTVTSVADEDGDGNALPGTLRQAILDANAHTGADTIAFSIGGGGLQTITAEDYLPNITDQVTIDGTTQPGYMNAPLIQINGSAVSAFDPGGLNFFVGGNVIKGIAIYGFYTNIALRNGGGSTVTGCAIGTDAATSGSFGSLNGILIVDGSAGNTIGGNTAATRNIISGNSSIGIYINGGSESGSNHIIGNYIGTNSAGDAALPNGNGIAIDNSPSNTIGGSETGEGNLVSGNTDTGIGVGGANAQNNVILGNYVGTDVTGAEALGNEIGISVAVGSKNSRVGGPNAGDSNLIAGNRGDGVSTNAGLFITVEGNIIGGDINGLPLGNGGSGIRNDYDGSNNTYVGNFIVDNNDGIFIAGGTDHTVMGNFILGNFYAGITIWDSSPNTRITNNSIYFNELVGVALLGPNNIVSNNAIAGNGSFGVYVSGVAGTDRLGTGNTISRNSIVDNGGTGIELSSDSYGGDGHQANDSGDADTGPNDYQNHPVMVIAGVQNGNTKIIGTFSGAPNATIRVELFANNSVDPSGYGQGETYLGFVNLTTNANGNANFNFVANDDLTGQFITSTATAANGSTSEFSAPVTAVTAASNVSANILVTRSGFRLVKTTGRYVQTVTLTNTSNAAIPGPVSLVLDSLSANATLFSPTGITAFNAPLGSPYRNAMSGSLAPHASVTVTLEFTNQSNAGITYSTRVLAGAGIR